MSVAPPIKVFIDTCTLQHAYPHVPAAEVVTLNWGGSDHLLEIESAKAKTFQGEFLNREVAYLPQLASLAAGGKVAYFTSELVIFELFGAPGTSLPDRPGHIFSEGSVTRIKSGFQYSLLIGKSRTLRNELHQAFESYPDVVLQSVRQQLGGDRLLDSVHLVTAHRHAMRYFLTTDEKLVNAFRKSPDLLSVWPVFPSELLRNLHEIE